MNDPGYPDANRPDVHFDLSARNLLALLSPDVDACLRAFAEVETQIENGRQARNASPASLPALPEAQRLARELRRHLEVVANLSVLIDADRLPDKERLMLPALAQAAIDHLRLTHSRNWEIDVATKESAPVYGSRRWLLAALCNLLRELDGYHPRQMPIVLTLRQIGHHQLLSPSVGRKSHTERQAKRSTPTPPDPWLSHSALSLQLCRRIVELHGGSLRLQEDEEESATRLFGFSLSLPTGIANQPPACNTDCPLRLQVERYASDFGGLLDELHKRKEQSI